jgi:hypothetical protein
MAFLYPSRAIPLTLRELAQITVADDKDVMVVPFDMEVITVHCYLGNTGTTSGNNDFVVEYTIPTGSTVTTSGDIWTIGAGVGRIAYNASAKYLAMDRDDLSKTYFEAGGTLGLNVNVVAGGGTPGYLEVILWVVPVNDS